MSLASDFGTAALKASGSLLLVVGLIICLLFLVKRLRFGGLPHSGYPRMRLLGRLHLAPKRAIALVEVEDQWLVLGVGTESVSLISRVARPPESDGPQYPGAGDKKKGLWERALNVARRDRDGES
jgi:flagellar protein FliO/FliZ